MLSRSIWVAERLTGELFRPAFDCSTADMAPRFRWLDDQRRAEIDKRVQQRLTKRTVLIHHVGNALVLAGGAVMLMATWPGVLTTLAGAILIVGVWLMILR